MDAKVVGSNVRAIRDSLKMSQRTLGDLIGKSESAVGNYESGTVDIPCSVLLKLAEAFGCGPEKLFGVHVDTFNPVAELRVYNQDDRQNVAGILVKNGYTVRQVKISREKGKSNWFCLQAKLDESSLATQ